MLFRSAALFIVSLALGQLWVAICIMGWILRLLMEKPLPRHPLFLLALFLTIPWLIRRGECDATYFMDGVACVIAVYIVASTGWLRTLLGLRAFAWFGSYTFELFLLHIPVYYTLRSIGGLLLDWSLVTPLMQTLLFVPVFLLVTAVAIGWRRLSQKTWLPLLNRVIRAFHAVK